MITCTHLTPFIRGALYLFLGVIKLTVGKVFMFSFLQEGKMNLDKEMPLTWMSSLDDLKKKKKKSSSK